MIQNVLVLGVLCAVTSSVLWVLWRRFAQAKTPRSLNDLDLDSTRKVLIAHGMEGQSMRVCMQTYVLSARSEQSVMEVELGDGVYDDYTRMRHRFESPLQHGVSISWQNYVSFNTMWARDPDVELGLAEIDDAFHLNALDKDRLRLLFHDRTIRTTLRTLRAQADRFALTDHSIELHIDRLIKDQELNDMLCLVESLVEAVEACAECYGPIADFDRASYAELLADLNLRDDFDDDRKDRRPDDDVPMPKGMDEISDIEEE